MLNKILYFACLFFAVTSISQGSQKPNVILIMADDVSWEAFGCYGAKDYQTPNLDQMAEQGLRFKHCFSTPICTTSRVQIMTGQHNFRNYTHFGYLNPNDRTFGNMMKDAGYKTAVAGKWQLNGLYNKLSGWDDSSRPLKAGFDEYCLWQLTKMKNDPDGGERFWSPTIEQNGKITTSDENQGKYGPDIFTDFICDFVERHKEEPFFVYYPMVLVHSPFVETPDTIGDKPKGQKANIANENQSKKHFVEMVRYTDKLVGKITKKLEDIGQLENTLIIFTADNGTNKRIISSWEDKKIKGGKGKLTNMGTHVPMIAYWKNHTPQGQVIDDLIDFTDFYPTLADLAGITLDNKDPIDGRSFFPQITGKPGNPKQWILCHYQPYWGSSPGQFVRTKEFKLYRGGKFVSPAKDLEEKKNIGKSGSNEKTQTARKKLQQYLQKCPPAPQGKANRYTKKRPIKPDWPNLLE